jgi:membrane fusion protein, multidrug efflux system
VIISMVIIVLVAACTVTLLINKKKIDEKAKLDGNLRSIPVFVTGITKSKLRGDFTANGSFSAIHELILMSEGQGKVEELLFNTGDFVSSGQVMVKLDDELIRSQLSLAETALEKSRKDMKKFEDLLKNDAIPSQQVEDARLALKKCETDVTALKKQLDFATIKAPIQGTVTKKMIEKGSLVMPGTAVAEIVDISRLKFIANVAENEAVQIRRGQKVTISTSLFTGISFEGAVVSVGVKADDARRFPVEIELVNNTLHSLKAGMFGTASFGAGAERETLMIPRHSLIGSIRIPHVYLIEQGKAVLKEIRIGSANDSEVEVLGGLKEGDLVVTSGQINLADNTPVSIVKNQ